MEFSKSLSRTGSQSQGLHKGAQVCVWRKAVHDEEVWESASDGRDKTVRLLSTLGRPWPTVSDANAFARSRAGVLRSREEEEEDEQRKKKKKTTTSRYTIPPRNSCPATAITPRSNCVLIHCLNIHLMLLSTYPLLCLELATRFSNAFRALSLYCGLFNDFF
jgi:hypothetical protein